MAELVIKIDDETYKEVMDRTENDTLSLGIKLIEAVQNGTPLPKGHGDLIDRSEAIKSLFSYHKGEKTLGQCIDDVQTIIEADKENKE